MVYTRCIARSIAHRNMERAGLKRVNKANDKDLGRDFRLGSYFSRHWRDYVNVPTIDLRRSKK